MEIDKVCSKEDIRYRTIEAELWIHNFHFPNSHYNYDRMLIPARLLRTFAVESRFGDRRHFPPSSRGPESTPRRSLRSRDFARNSRREVESRHSRHSLRPNGVGPGTLSAPARARHARLLRRRPDGSLSRGRHGRRRSHSQGQLGAGGGRLYEGKLVPVVAASATDQVRRWTERNWNNN